MKLDSSNTDLKHISNERLIEYVLRPDYTDAAVGSDSKTNVPEHLRHCELCRSTVTQLKQIIGLLSSNAHPIHSLAEDDHLSVSDVIGYLFEDVSAVEMSRTQSHIDVCGACAKRLLLLQTHLHEAGSPKIKTGPERGNTSVNSKGNWRRQNQSPYFLWTAAMLTVVAFGFVFLVLFQPASLDPGVNRDSYPLMTRSPPSGAGFPVSSLSGIKVGNSVTNSINWYSGYVEATAIGTVDHEMVKNKLQAESVAAKTARHVAYAKISEMINGVFVTSEVTYKDMVSKSDSLLVRHEGLIQNAHIVEESLVWQDDLPKATVTLRVPLYGAKGISGVISNGKAELNVTLPINQAPNTQKVNYIVDARNTNFKPSLLPAYAVKGIHNELERSRQIVAPRYYASIQNAKTALKTRTAVKVVKAQPDSQTGLLVLSRKDLELVSSDKNSLSRNWSILF